MKKIPIAAFMLLLGFLAVGFSVAPAQARLETGQTLYVPCYSEIFHGMKQRLFPLTVTLSVRNVDLKRSVTLTAVDYYDTEGKKLSAFLESPVVLGPLMTKKYVIDQGHTEGGPGSNFIVTWSASEPVNPPLIEAVMIGTSANQGISFTSRGVVIE